jgi:hypothetical protein
MTLLSAKAREVLDKRADELLLFGKSWRDRIGRELIDSLQLEAPRLFRRDSSGKLKSVESALRSQRRSQAREDVKKSMPPVGLRERWDHFFQEHRWDEIDWETPSHPEDPSGVGQTSGPPHVLTDDGIFYFKEGIARGWAPETDASETFWLLDNPATGLRDFTLLLHLHQSVRNELEEKARVSDRWLWDSLIEWIRSSSRQPARLSLTEHLENSFASEPTSWEVALLLDGVQLSDSWEIEDPPVSVPWLGQRIVDGRFLVGKILDAVLPSRDAELFELSDEFLNGDGPHREILDNYDWLLFSPFAGDRYSALEARIREASELCALLTLFDGTDTRSEHGPSILRTDGELCAILIPASTESALGRACEPISLRATPQPFPPHYQSSAELHLDATTRRFQALAERSGDFQRLRHQNRLRRELMNAIMTSIRRLARARREPDDHERLFLLVSALDALLVGKPPPGGDSQTKLFTRRFANVVSLGNVPSGEFDAAKIACSAYDERSTFAHGSDLKEKLTSAERDKFGAWAIEIARKLFLAAGSWESLAQLRLQLDDASSESIAALKSLDDYVRIFGGEKPGEAN